MFAYLALKAIMIEHSFHNHLAILRPNYEKMENYIGYAYDTGVKIFEMRWHELNVAPPAWN